MSLAHGKCAGASELSKYVSHQKLILPQLGATGVSAHEVKRGTGYDVEYGPVRASDVKDYIVAGYKATKEMRTVQFNLWDRLVLTPMEMLPSLIFDGDNLCSLIYADFTDKTLMVENYVNDPVRAAFGNNMLPTWVEFQTFLEERCMPRGRDGLREYLEVIGVGAYDPLEIIRKTAGRMAEDKQWLEMEDIK